MTITRRDFGLGLVCFLAVAGAPGGAAAQDAYPTKPIRLIVPFAPGGATDILGRLLGQKIGEFTGQQVVVENRPGAAGNIGTAAVARAPADGYTLLMGFDGTLAINPSVYAKLEFDVRKDFAPISKLADVPLVMVAGPSVTAGSLAEVVAAARRGGKPLSFSSAGTGSTGHLVGELLARATGAPMSHVPYKGGGQAVNDVLAGHVDLLFVAIPTVQAHIASGKLKALGVSSAKRAVSLPDVPTFAESGVSGTAGFDVSSWYGLLAPAGTPPAVINALHGHVVRALAAPDMRERMQALGAVPVGNAPAAYRADIEADTTRWAGVIKQIGLKAD